MLPVYSTAPADSAENIINAWEILDAFLVASYFDKNSCYDLNRQMKQILELTKLFLLFYIVLVTILTYGK